VLGGGAELRRAREAEAGGDYLAAARAYASCGDRAKVGEMHLLLAERSPGPDARLDSLREAARWADGDDPRSKKVLARVATAMLAWVRARGIVTDGDRAVVADAARLFLAAGDAAGAGRCHELLGAAEDAATAYQEAGDVDRLERLLDGEADRRRRSVALTDALDEHRLRLRGGDVGAALAALEAALHAAEPADRAGLQRMRDELVGRRITRPRLALVGAGRRLIAAPAPALLGRGEECTLMLRDVGVSRRHAELRRGADGWVLVDLGSKNGSRLDGARVAGTRPLAAAAALELGDHCGLELGATPETLTVSVRRGLDAGTELRLGERVPLGPSADPLCEVRFVDGRPRLRGLGRALFLNGASTGAEVEPLLRDVIEVGGARWEVEA
jgi:hypothetical protein